MASEQFRRRVLDASNAEQDTVIFLTGVPGAGKTTAILSESQLESNVRMVYEGQLARPETVIPKIEQVLAAGLRPVIVAVAYPRRGGARQHVAALRAARTRGECRSDGFHPGWPAAGAVRDSGALR